MERLAGKSVHARHSAALLELEVNLGDLLSLGSDMKAGRVVRPMSRVRAVVHRELLAKTFQGYDQVASALALSAGRPPAPRRGQPRRPGPMSQVATSLKLTPDQLRARLNKIVQRRNQIVHEGDYRRMIRPRRRDRNPIDFNSVTDDVAWLVGLVDAIESLPR